ncbi:MAG: AMP-binding protein, partial [Pseudomonadota bacterium]
MSRTMAAVAGDFGFELPVDWNASRLLWDNLKDRAHRPAYFYQEEVWTYAKLAEEASRIGSHLSNLGCQPGNRVLLVLDDTPTYPAAIMGCLRAGLVPILINTLSPAEMVHYFLKDSEATASIIEEDFKDLFPADALETTDCKRLVIADERPWAAASADLEEHPVKRDDMAFWMYSSGSTGKPKGVVHDHEDAAYACDTFGAHILDIGPDDICFSVPKIFFAYGFGNSVLFPMRVGASTILLSGRPTSDRVIETISTLKPTMLFALPTVYSTLVNSPDFETADMSSVRMFLSAAEVLSEELANIWKSKFGKPIIEGLGSTEMTHIYLSNTSELQKPGAAGKPVTGYEVRLIAPDGTEVQDGGEGVMEVIGLSRADYYWNRPEKTAESMKG